MKTIRKVFYLIIAFTLSFNALASNSIESSTWEDVIVIKRVKELESIENLIELAEIEGKASKVFGSKSSLKKKAIEDMKKKAHELGATHIFIEEEEFSNSPINNVQSTGIAYKIETAK